jgi:hypothetical protein
LSEEAKYQNVIRGVIISGVATFIAYLVTSIISFIVGYFIYTGFILLFDLQFLIGTIFGVIYFIKTRRTDQSILAYGVIVGVCGGILAAFFIGIYQWIILLDPAYFIQYFLGSLITGALGCFLIAVIICVLYMYREVKKETREEEYDKEDFFKDLVED